MRPLVLLCSCLLLPGCGALTGLKNIRGSEGDTVSILCTYGEKLRNHQKYWCRKAGILFERCSGTIYARADGRENTEGRVSIQDSPRELRFNVTLRALTLEDSGEYWCGIQMLGFDRSLLVSLVVLPGPRSAPSPTPFVQPLATSLQPKAKAWQTQPTALTLPGVHPQVTTAKWGKTEAEASPLTGTSPPEHTGASLYTGTSPHAGTPPRAGASSSAGTSPREETSPHKATSPHAGTSGPSTHLDSASAKDASLLPSSSSSKSRVCPATVRALAPALVLLALLLVSGLCALGRYILQWRKKVQLATETQRNEKVHHSHLTSEQEEAPVQAPNGDALPGPPLHMSEELRRSVFVSV
ncbi:CMRF35-like molecule 9 isoform X3 [Artibeus jamaicensis]|uniref:CMRF35-like molecule 9 isoform X3 n=1 Tax=Artibeus jamaicensis TaxID=9417 RepID=UPI00235A5DE9|nr:CMRF35-like molecule 9 isoform X3 [Artibeus jamaicensis]